MQANRSIIRALETVMKKRGYIDIPSSGVSMFPLIRTGTVCRFEPATDEIRAGDILLFVTGTGALVGHRYLGVTVPDSDGEPLYLCKGDSTRTIDPPVRKEQILGRMVSMRRFGIHHPADRAWMIAWGRLLLRFPALSAAIHLYLRWTRKRQGLKHHSWAS